MRTYTKDIEKETERKSAEKMIKDRELSLEKIARYVPALSMDELKEIDKTTYLVEVHFSDTSNQSVEDKLKRVILHDLEHGKLQQALQILLF